MVSGFKIPDLDMLPPFRCITRKKRSLRPRPYPKFQPELRNQGLVSVGDSTNSQPGPYRRSGAYDRTTFATEPWLADDHSAPARTPLPIP